MPQKLGSYDVYGTLGKGSITRIRFALNNVTNVSYAIKIIDKKKLKDSNRQDSIKNEIAIMKTIDNKHCLHIYDTFANSEKIFIVLDLMMAGSLYSYFKKRGKFSEPQARHYLQQIYFGVEACHMLGIIVGGLTLNSILVDRAGNAKISDFEYAQLGTNINGNSIGNQAAIQYLAPELVNWETSGSTISELTDIWAMAVILYTLVAGIFPFDQKQSLEELQQNISMGLYEPFPRDFSVSLIEMLTTMFAVDPVIRLNMEGMHENPWMQWNTYGISAYDPAGNENGSYILQNDHLHHTNSSAVHCDPLSNLMQIFCFPQAERVADGNSNFTENQGGKSGI